MVESTAIETTSVVARALGGAEVLELAAGDVPDPGPAEVRVRVEASAISYADLLVMQGVHPERRSPPFVPGWDVVGVVDAVGSAVSGVASGDRVAGLSIHGGWAERAVVRGDWVVPVPDELDATKVVCLVMDDVVAYQMLTRSARSRAGDTVLFQGVGGGVGTAFMQIARTMGVRVLGTDRERKRAHVEAHGATLIDFEHEDVVARCRALTDGRGVDAAFDGVGDTALQSLRAVRRGGRLVWFGMVTMLQRGERHISKMLKTAGVVGAVFAPHLVPGGKRASIYSIQRLARRHPEWYREDLAALIGMLADGTIDPEVAAVWELAEVPTAIAELARGALPGKQVIRVGGA